MRWTRVRAAWSGSIRIRGRKGRASTGERPSSGDRVYFTTTDNYLTALDRRTGVVIFSRKFADENKGTTSTSAPLVVKDKVHRRQRRRRQRHARLRRGAFGGDGR